MIVEKLEQQDHFTHAEKQVVDYILNHPFEIQNLTATDLGMVTFTSKATIFRLCKKLGVSSFDEFKHTIDMEMKERERLNALLEEEPFHRNSTLQEIIHIFPSFYDTAIHHTKITLDDKVIKQVITQLEQANVIDLYCSGITTSCALGAQFKFLSLGKECGVYTSINEHYSVATKNKKTVAILLSFTGKNPGILHIAKYLKTTHTYIVGIGGNEVEDLKNLCDCYIPIYQKKLVMSFEMMTPYISMTYILDILFAGLLVRHYDQHLKDSIEIKNNKAF